jgi:hypothetical protein
MTAAATWNVMRRDDNGNTFVVACGLTRGEATALAESLARRGHKQDYWVEREADQSGDVA